MQDEEVFRQTEKELLKANAENRDLMLKNLSSLIRKRYPVSIPVLQVNEGIRILRRMTTPFNTSPLLEVTQEFNLNDAYQSLVKYNSLFARKDCFAQSWAFTSAQMETLVIEFECHKNEYDDQRGFLNELFGQTLCCDIPVVILQNNSISCTFPPSYGTLLIKLIFEKIKYCEVKGVQKIIIGYFELNISASNDFMVKSRLEQKIHELEDELRKMKKEMEENNKKLLDTKQERDKYKEKLEKVKTLERGNDHEEDIIIVAHAEFDSFHGIPDILGQYTSRKGTLSCESDVGVIEQLESCACEALDFIDDGSKNPEKGASVQCPCSSDRCQCIGGDDYDNGNDPWKSQEVLEDDHCDLEVLEQQIIESPINNSDNEDNADNENDPGKSQKVLKDEYCDLEVSLQIIESLINNADNKNDSRKSQKVLKDEYCDLEDLEQQMIQSLIDNVDKVEKQEKKQVHFKELDSITNKHHHLRHELLKYSNDFSLEAIDDLEKDTLSKSSKAQCPYCNLELELSSMEGHKTECLYHQPCNELFESPDSDELQVNGIIDSETDACVPLIAHCPYCNLEKEVDAMEAHKDKCSHRPCICQYCKKEVKNEKLSEHYVICDNNPVPEMSYF